MKETEADLRIEQAKKNIDEAYFNLYHALHPDTEGSKHFSDEYFKELTEILCTLNKLRD